MLLEPVGPNAERSELPGGSTLVTLRGDSAGPALALLGGVHGDEDEGVLAVRRILRELSQIDFAGAVLAVAPANPDAWNAFSRCSPIDGKNLARCFPGDPKGSPTEVIAASLTGAVIAPADFLIDLHSAGVRYAMPLMCGYASGEATADDSRRAAEAFGATVIWAHPNLPPGRTLSTAAARGVPAIYAECSGGGGITGSELQAYLDGVKAVMAQLGMLALAASHSARSAHRRVSGDGDLDKGVAARTPGFFVTSTEAGGILEEGSEVGRLFNSEGQLAEVIEAPIEGMVMFLRRQARVDTGDVLVVMAEPEPSQ